VKGAAFCSRCRSREFPRPLLSRPRPAKPDGAWKRHQRGRFVTAAGCNEYPLESGLPLLPFPSTGSVSGNSEGTHGNDRAERSLELGRRAASACVRRSAPDSMRRSAWAPQALQTSAARRRQGWKPEGERRRLDAQHDSPVGNAETHCSCCPFFRVREKVHRCSSPKKKIPKDLWQSMSCQDSSVPPRTVGPSLLL
jgi:hypothetical protein